MKNQERIQERGKHLIILGENGGTRMGPVHK
jgi:hypothetical protein